MIYFEGMAAGFCNKKENQRRRGSFRRLVSDKNFEKPPYYP